jgi:hypothetical protein
MDRPSLSPDHALAIIGSVKNRRQQQAPELPCSPIRATHRVAWREPNQVTRPSAERQRITPDLPRSGSYCLSFASATL